MRPSTPDSTIERRPGMETAPESHTSQGASGSRRGHRESLYKPYTPKEPSTCKSEGWKKDAHHVITSRRNNPVAFGCLLNDLFQEIHRDHLPGLDSYVKWIKPQSWYHWSVLKERTDKCPHLLHAPHPPPNIMKPSKSTLRFLQGNV